MNPSLMIVDMLKDTFDKHSEAPVVQTARAFLPQLNKCIDAFHQRGFPVIFACDSFLTEDFIFRGKMKPHSLRGHAGSEPIDQLHREPSDHVLPKRRFSAFFKTDLDQTLRTWNVDTVWVAGIATPICVLTSALDAVSHDFKAVIIEDCCAAHRPEQHDMIVKTYRKTPLHPLLSVESSERCLQVLAWLGEERGID
jgi:nicotinamidase/pyrazinamidase